MQIGNRLLIPHTDHGNQIMAASAPHDPVVCLDLTRILAMADTRANTCEGVLHAAGPERLSDVVNFHVGDWSRGSVFKVGEQAVGGIYAGGTVTSLYPPIFFPYWFDQGTWATCNPRKHPDAWGAHHWEAAWHPK